MDDFSGKPENSGTYIWLRYATQFSVGERTHTIEMGIPVPLGASEALRAQLLREAEAGMEQLANHVENRVVQFTQSAQAPARTQTSVGTQATRTYTPQTAAPPSKSAIPTEPQTTPASASQSVPASRTTAAATPSSASSEPVPPAPTVSVPTTSREAAQPTASSAKDVAVPPTRHSIGASMPSAPSIPGDSGGSLKLPQFIQYIKEAMGLTPKQAMDLLNVKTLSGLNLRDALEQLQSLVARDVSATPTVVAPVVRDTKTPPVTAAPATVLPATPPAPTPAARQTPSMPTPPGIKEITNAVVRDVPPAYPAFDEEIDLENLDEELDLGEDAGIEFLPELTDQERGIAEDVFNRLKDVRGTSTASDARLRALHNVVSGQISDEQLLQITEGVWGINAIKKLKSDQVETLISWAKQDEFITEAEILIMLLQEGQYARSDR